jgi:NADPH-dependent 2,4-dienoyl-CoA reductase/sulfur reductase-like enzyme
MDARELGGPEQERGAGACQCCIIGAGVAGLQTARALLKQGIEVVLLEQLEAVGGARGPRDLGAGLHDRIGRDRRDHARRPRHGAAWGAQG